MYPIFIGIIQTFRDYNINENTKQSVEQEKKIDKLIAKFYCNIWQWLPILLRIRQELFENHTRN